MVWLGAIPFEGSYEESCGAVEEGSSYSIESALWPPGLLKCVVTAPDGTKREHTYVPWRERLTVALIAAGAGLGAAALTARRRRILLATGPWASSSPA